LLWNIARASACQLKKWSGCVNRHRHARRSRHSQLRRSIHSRSVERHIYYASRSRRITPASAQAWNGNGSADRIACRHSRARNGIMAQLPLHCDQWFGRRGFAEAPADHERGELFEPAFGSEVIGFANKLSILRPSSEQALKKRKPEIENRKTCHERQSNESKMYRARSHGH